MLPTWQGELEGLPFPLQARLGLGLSVALAHLLALLWFRRPLSRAAPALLARMVHHGWWPLRALVQWWKLVALVTHAPSAPGAAP